MDNYSAEYTHYAMAKTTLLGRRLKEIRDKRDWSQSELEKRSGIPAVMISQFETGVRKNPSAATLVKLANALSISMDYLLGRTDVPTPVGGPVAVLLRTLEGASGTTFDAVTAVGKHLTDQERARGEKPKDG